MSNRKSKAGKELSKAKVYSSRINKARGFSEVWEIVKDTVEDSLGEHRVGMMLFLDDLPLHLGACMHERNLRKIFPGEYEEYSQRVTSWIPRKN